ncbi:MAG: hypothetical protein LUG95_00290 [Clostridiales bacterium]|nr:hypothetical protein [Clostridiales bacterium]
MIYYDLSYITSYDDLTDRVITDLKEIVIPSFECTYAMGYLDTVEKGKKQRKFSQKKKAPV